MSNSLSFAQTSTDTITITTYYPSPFGIYNELRSKKMAIGDTYYDLASYYWTGSFPNIDPNASLVVEGNVGIGTTNPAYNLDVVGNIRATGSVYYGGTSGNANGTAYTKPDYVFKKGYKVLSIEKVDKFLRKNGHLPWITSTRQEQKENGKAINMTRMSFEAIETAENLQMQIITLNEIFITPRGKPRGIQFILRSQTWIYPTTPHRRNS